MSLNNYRHAFSESSEIENSFDPCGKLGLMIADQAQEDTSTDPFDVLANLEDEMGCSLVEAAKRYYELMHTMPHLRKS